MINNDVNRMAMTRPDRELIAQVMLFSQGFRTAESLASKIVPFFNLCDEQLSPQPHYDFGLRALKAVLASAGVLKRERMQSTPSEDSVGGLSDTISEQIILIQSVTETIVPKLVADDVPLLTRFGLPLVAVICFLIVPRQSSCGRLPWRRLSTRGPGYPAGKDSQCLCRATPDRRRALDR